MYNLNKLKYLKIFHFITENLDVLLKTVLSRLDLIIFDVHLKYTVIVFLYIRSTFIASCIQPIKKAQVFKQVNCSLKLFTLSSWVDKMFLMPPLK